MISYFRVLSINKEISLLLYYQPSYNYITETLKKAKWLFISKINYVRLNKTIFLYNSNIF
jgi:hypothetical protein